MIYQKGLQTQCHSIIVKTLLIGDNSVTNFGSVDSNISIRSDKNMKIQNVFTYLAGLPDKCVDNITMVRAQMIVTPIVI